MCRIILIETSTALCSTALCEDGKVVCYRQSDTPRSHASLTAVFVQEMLQEQGLSVRDCDAVAVSSGPGSYTGLRVGSSTAKGLCFGAGIPLIALNTADILIEQAHREGLVPDGCRHVIPMIDARRMEVYTKTDSIRSVVVGPDSFASELSDGICLFIGDGALKCKDVINHPDARYADCCPKASAMAVPATLAFKEKRFEDTAYFEPFYLKDFVATVSSKKLF